MCEGRTFATAGWTALRILRVLFSIKTRTSMERLDRARFRGCPCLRTTHSAGAAFSGNSQHLVRTLLVRMHFKQVMQFQSASRGLARLEQQAKSSCKGAVINRVRAQQILSGWKAQSLKSQFGCQPTPSYSSAWQTMPRKQFS